MSVRRYKNKCRLGYSTKNLNFARRKSLRNDPEISFNERVDRRVFGQYRLEQSMPFLMKKEANQILSPL